MWGRCTRSTHYLSAFHGLQRYLLILLLIVVLFVVITRLQVPLGVIYCSRARSDNVLGSVGTCPCTPISWNAKTLSRRADYALHRRGASSSCLLLLPLIRVGASSLIHQHLWAFRLFTIPAIWGKLLLPQPRWYRDASACLHLLFAKTINVCIRKGISLLCISSCNYPGVLTGDTTVPDRGQGWLNYRLPWLLLFVMLLLLNLQVLLWWGHQRRVCSDLARCLLLCPRKHRSCGCGCCCPALVLCRRNSSLGLLETLSGLIASSIKCWSTRTVSRCWGFAESILWSVTSLLCRVVASANLANHWAWFLWSEWSIYTRPRWHIWTPFNLELSAPIPLHFSHGSRMTTFNFRNISSTNINWFLTRG